MKLSELPNDASAPAVSDNSALPQPSNDATAPVSGEKKVLKLSQVSHAPEETSATPDNERTGFIGAKIGSLKDLKTSDVARHAKETIGLDPEADYTTGLPFSQKTEFLMMDNDKERQNFLDNYYPGAKFVQDKQGNTLIKMPNGQKIEPKGLHPFKNLAAEGLANALPIGGGMMASASTLAATKNPIAAAAAFPAGQTLGYGAREQLKAGFGLEKKSEKEYIENLGQQAKMGMETEVGGQVFGKALKTIYGGYPFGIPLLPSANKEMTKRVLDRNMSPPFLTAMPGSTVLQQKQSFLERVVGSSRNAYNAAGAKAGMADILEKSGVDKAQIPEMINSIMRGEVDTKSLGEQATKYYKSYVDGLQKTSDTMSKEASNIMDKKWADINKAIANPKIETSEAVINDIRTAKQQFSDASSSMYGTVDELNGNKAILSTAPMKAEIKKMIADLPKNKAGNVIFPGEGGAAASQYIRDLLDQPDLITFRQGQAIRSQLMQAGYSGEITSSVGERNLTKLADSADSMFARAAKGYYKSGGEGDAAKQSALALEKADKFYAENIGKFKDADVARLARDSGRAGAVRPEDVVKYVADPKYASKMNKILPMLSPQTKQAVAHADFQNMVENSTSPVTGKISGVKLLKEIDKRESTAPQLWGKRQAAEIKIYAKRLAALNEEIPIKDLQGDSSFVASKLRMSAKTREEADAMLKEGNSYLAALSKPGYLHDNALKLIMQPGEVHRLEQALKVFRGTPVEQQIKTSFAQNLLSKMSDPKNLWEKFSSGGAKMNATAFSKEVNKYSNKQLEMIFGKNTAKDLKTYADDMDFAMGSSIGNVAAGLAGGAAKMKIGLLHPATWPYFASLMIAENIITRPGFVRWLVLGVQPGTGAKIFQQSMEANYDRFLENHKKDILDYDRKIEQQQ